MGRFGVVELIIILAIPCSILFWLWTLVDCLVHERPGSKDKVVWIIVLMLGNCLGAVLYLVLRRPQRLRESEAARAAGHSP